MPFWGTVGAVNKTATLFPGRDLEFLVMKV